MPGASGTWDEYTFEEDPETAAKKKQLARMMGSRYTEGAPGGDFPELIRGLPSPEEAAGGMGPGLGPVAGALSSTHLDQLRKIYQMSKRDPQVLAWIINKSKSLPQKMDQAITNIRPQESLVQELYEKGQIPPERLQNYLASRGTFDPKTAQVGVSPTLGEETTVHHEGIHALLEAAAKGTSNLPGQAQSELSTFMRALNRWYWQNPEEVQKLSQLSSTGMANVEEPLAAAFGELMTGGKYRRDFSKVPPFLQHMSKKLRRWSR